MNFVRAARASLAVALVVGLTVVVPASVTAADPSDESPDAAELLDPFEPETSPEPADVSIDRWSAVPGQSLADVPAGTAPTETFEQVGALESPVNVADAYAIRMRTLVTPEQSGRYRFWVSGDDDMRLFLNAAGDDPAGAERIAYIAGWTTYQQWNRFWSQRSAWIDLEAGVPYYLEAIGKEGSGDDHFSVAWELEDTFGRQLVPAHVLEATQLGSGGWRSSTPIGLPGIPAEMTDPQWTSVTGPSTIALGWAEVDGADWYEVRLEGAGQHEDVIVDSAGVVFGNLVPDTRYLIEVAPASAAGRRSHVGRVVVTDMGPYPTPVAPTPGPTPTVTYDHWATGWWTLTSVPFGLAPDATTTLSTGLEALPMQGTNHATRLRAVITPTRTDTYTLYLSGDDDARLLFNAEGPWAHGAEPVAYVSGWTEQYQWDRYQSQESPEFHLEAGRSYYVEAIGVHGLGLDHLEVGWKTPDSDIVVIPPEVLEPTMSGAGGWREDASSLAAAPGAVVALTPTWSDDGALELTWQPPTVDDGHGPAAHYDVEPTDGTTSSVAETTWSADGFTPGDELRFAVRAHNEVGAGPATEVAVVVPEPPTTSTSTTTSTTSTSTTTSTTSTTTAPSTTTPSAFLRLTFMCRAVDGGDIVNDDYVGADEEYPAGAYVWRVRSENAVGPVEFAVRVGGGDPFHTGVLDAWSTEFFTTSDPHQGASVYWPGGSKGTASTNETSCETGETTTTTTTTTATTTVVDPECDRPGNGNGQAHAHGHGCESEPVDCERPGVGNQDGLGNGNGQGHAHGHGCGSARVESGEPPVPLDDEQIDGVQQTGKRVGKRW